MAGGLALELFEPRAEAFWSARNWREWQFLSGQRPGRGLVGLYDDDFPEFTSTDFWADLQAAAVDDPRQHRSLSALLAAAYLEGRTRAYAVSATRVQATASVQFEDNDFAWRDAPTIWPLLAEVPRRHELEEAWRGVWRSDLNATLERWHESLRAELRPLGLGDDWLQLWSVLRATEWAEVGKLAQTLLDGTSEVYAHGLGIYFGQPQLELPVDDAWISDADWAFRAPRFDTVFAEPRRMPVLIRTLRDLGIELEEQTNMHLEYAWFPGVHCIPVHVPSEVRLLVRLGGGWQDYARSLIGLGMAQHAVHTDPTLHFWERALGDETQTLGYGLLLESLVRDRAWLTDLLDYAASDDFRVISRLAWLYRLRQLAASTLYEQRLWCAEPGASMASDFEESLSTATRVHHLRDCYLETVVGGPLSAWRSATWLRAEVFAAQLRAYLVREFDEEWWRSTRAARFIKDELWRPGRRHTAEDLLAFMGCDALSNPSILVSEFEEVLRPL